MPYGISHKKDSANELGLNNLLMGDKYAEALSKILPFKQNGFTLSLRNNRLSQKGADTIVEKLNKHVTKLDFSFNPNIKTLNFNKLIVNMEFALTSLSLEGNSIGDNNVIKL